MPSRHHGQVNRPRSATKARHEQSGPTVHVPMPAEPQYCHRPGSGYGGKQSATPTTSARSHDAPHLRSHQGQHDFRFMGAWCHEVPESHYTRRIKVDTEDHHRPQRLPHAPTPPRVPNPPRLNNPRSLLAYDAEFASAQARGNEDDRVGGAYYLSREAKTNRQCEQFQSCLVRVLSYLFADASTWWWWWWWWLHTWGGNRVYLWFLMHSLTC